LDFGVLRVENGVYGFFGVGYEVVDMEVFDEVAKL
jgi:hypothetical protein